MTTATRQNNPATTIKGIAQGRRDLFYVDPENLVVVEDPTHPLYDERVNLPLSEDFVADVMANGIIQNVIIRKNGELFEVVAGRQRVKAAVEANKRYKKARSETRVSVPVVVRKDDDVASAGLTISENEQRTADTPMVQARKAQRMIDLGEDKARVAQRFRMSKDQLNKLLTMLDADTSVQKAVEAGAIHVTAASKLVGLSRDEQKQAMADLRAAGVPMTKVNVGAKVKARKEAKATGAPERAITTPPKRSVIIAVCDAYQHPDQVANPPEDQNPLDLAHALLTWVLTGTGAANIIGPHGTPGNGMLADWLRDYEVTGGAKPAVAPAATA